MQCLIRRAFNNEVDWSQSCIECHYEVETSPALIAGVCVHPSCQAECLALAETLSESFVRCRCGS